MDTTNTNTNTNTDDGATSARQAVRVGIHPFPLPDAWIDGSRPAWNDAHEGGAELGEIVDALGYLLGADVDDEFGGPGDVPPERRSDFVSDAFYLLEAGTAARDPWAPHPGAGWYVAVDDAAFIGASWDGRIGVGFGAVPRWVALPVKMSGYILTALRSVESASEVRRRTADALAAATRAADDLAVRGGLAAQQARLDAALALLDGLVAELRAEAWAVYRGEAYPTVRTWGGRDELTAELLGVAARCGVVPK